MNFMQALIFSVPQFYKLFRNYPFPGVLPTEHQTKIPYSSSPHIAQPANLDYCMRIQLSTNHFLVSQRKHSLTLVMAKASQARLCGIAYTLTRRATFSLPEKRGAGFRLTYVTT